MSPYIQGYVAAARWGWPTWMNPWPLFVFPGPHGHWNHGYLDACADRQDARLGRLRKRDCRVEPECAGRVWVRP